MEVKSLVKLTKGRAKICLAGGADLSPESYQEICSEILIPRCKKRALHLLEKQDRSEQNLRDKLREGGYPSEIIDIAIDYINDYGYLDDARMAASHVRFYQESRSKKRIKQDLLNKGVAPDVIDSVIEEEYTVDELDLIQELMDKKHYDRENATYEDKAKMYRFLAGRGYSSDTIKRALN